MVKFVLIGIYVFIACIAILVIYHIRHKHISSGSVIDEIQSRDFIDEITQFKKNQLDSQPWNMKYETYVAIASICCVIFAVGGYLAKGVSYAVLGGIIGVLIPELIVRIQSAAQKQKFEERYARGLRQLSAALKSGLSLHQAIEDVCHSNFIHDDIRLEFQHLSADLKLGVSVQDAFEKFAKRVGFADAYDVAIAVSMQAKVGGREAAVIEAIAKNISDRMMLRKEIRTMFSGSNMTMSILDILPFGIVAFLVTTASDFVGVYFESLEMFIVFIALIGFMLVGSVVTRSMVRKMKKECGIQ